MEYTELELNKMIAELEGVKTHLSLLADCELINTISYGVYDPVKDWRLLGPLMVKYKVSVFYPVKVISIASEFSGKPPAARVDYKDKSEIPRAIIMCILKSENII